MPSSISISCPPREFRLRKEICGREKGREKNSRSYRIGLLLIWKLIYRATVFHVRLQMDILPFSLSPFFAWIIKTRFKNEYLKYVKNARKEPTATNRNETFIKSPSKSSPLLFIKKKSFIFCNFNWSLFLSFNNLLWDPNDHHKYFSLVASIVKNERKNASVQIVWFFKGLMNTQFLKNKSFHPLTHLQGLTLNCRLDAQKFLALFSSIASPTRVAVF